MTRLTNGLRNEIVAALMNHTIGAEVDALRVRKANLASLVYADAYPNSLREILEKSPDGHFPSTTTIGARFGATDEHYLTFNGDGLYSADTIWAYGTKPDHITKRVLYKHHSHYSSHGIVMTVFDATHPLSALYDELIAERKRLYAKLERGRGAAGEVLLKFTTVEKLIEEWPEIEPFVPKAVVEPKNALVAVDTGTLNELFDLPVDEETENANV